MRHFGAADPILMRMNWSLCFVIALTCMQNNRLTIFIYSARKVDTFNGNITERQRCVCVCVCMMYEWNDIDLISGVIQICHKYNRIFDVERWMNDMNENCGDSYKTSWIWMKIDIPNAHNGIYPHERKGCQHYGKC